MIKTLIIALTLLQVAPPPPPPGGSELQSFQVRRRFNNTPITNLPIDYEYSGRRLRLALGMQVFDGDGNLIEPKPVRGWFGYGNILTGINNGDILITSVNEWNILYEYALNNSKNPNRLCKIAKRKGGYVSPICPGVPIPKAVNILLLFSFLIILKKVYNLAESNPLEC